MIIDYSNWHDPPLRGIARDATSHQELLMTIVITLIDLKDVVCANYARCVKSKKSSIILHDILIFLIR